jgi:hypothetical protein
MMQEQVLNKPQDELPILIAMRLCLVLRFNIRKLMYSDTPPSKTETRSICLTSHFQIHLNFNSIRPINKLAIFWVEILSQICLPSLLTRVNSVTDKNSMRLLIRDKLQLWRYDKKWW